MAVSSPIPPRADSTPCALNSALPVRASFRRTISGSFASSSDRQDPPRSTTQMSSSTVTCSHDQNKEGVGTLLCPLLFNRSHPDSSLIMFRIATSLSTRRTLWVSSDGTALPAYIHAGALSSYKGHIDSRNRYYCNPEAANISFPI